MLGTKRNDDFEPYWQDEKDCDESQRSEITVTASNLVVLEQAEWLLIDGSAIPRPASPALPAPRRYSASNCHHNDYFELNAIFSAVSAIPRNGTTAVTASRAIASLGIPKTTQLASSWAMVRAPALRISSRPCAPSLPMPVMMTPTACDATDFATERKSTSTLGLWRDTSGRSLT